METEKGKKSKVVGLGSKYHKGEDRKKEAAAEEAVNLVLDVLNLRCLLDNQVEVSS